jgi:predicted amidohydrolase YtcJ
MRKLAAAALIAFAASACVSAGGDRGEADQVYWGGPIYTANEAQPTAEAVAVAGGVVSFVGSRADAQALVGPGTEVVDLGGGALFPGFTDAHAHLRGIGEREYGLNLEGAASLAEAMQRVADHLARTEADGPVWGRGWIETAWPERRFVTRADIDAVSAEIPIILTRADGHAAAANSAALAAAGIDAATPAPEGGEILKDAAGHPTGMLIDNAMALLEPLRVPPAGGDAELLLQTALEVEAAYGWTGAHNMSVPWSEVTLLEDMAARGEVPIHVYNAVAVEDADALIAEGPRRSADGRVRTRAVKLYADGALGSRGAALFDPYADADTSGLLVTSRAALARDLGRLHAAGLQAATHAIGDRANDLVLDLYEEILSEDEEGPARRWRIEHAQVLRPVDIPRFAELGVVASMQPSHAIGDLHFAPDRLGLARLEGAYAWASLIETGAILAAGSDAPVERGDPLIEFYAAIARRDLDGYAGPGWRPEEAMSRADALRAFTLWPAYASFMEDETGSIEVGTRADFSGFSVDLMQAEPAEILAARAILTVVDGEIVHDCRTGCGSGPLAGR